MRQGVRLELHQTTDTICRANFDIQVLETRARLYNKKKLENNFETKSKTQIETNNIF